MDIQPSTKAAADQTGLSKPPAPDKKASGSENEKQVETQQASGNLQSINTVQEMQKALAEGEKIPISQQQLIKSIDQALKAIQGPETTIEFSVNKATHQIVAKVLNKDTGQIIREIPPEKSLDFLAKLWEKAGIILDQRI